MLRSYNTKGKEEQWFAIYVQYSHPPRWCRELQWSIPAHWRYSTSAQLWSSGIYSYMEISFSISKREVGQSQWRLLLFRPRYSSVGNQASRGNVPKLGGKSAPGVEDCVMKSSREGILTIGRKSIGDYSFLWRRACLASAMAFMDLEA